MNIEKEIVEIVAEILQMPPSDISLEASFFDEYGMDSLRALEIMAEIENRYGITIDPDRLMEMTNVSQVIQIAKECIDQRDA